MSKFRVSQKSLYVTLGIIIVSTVLVIMTMQTVYTYYETKNRTMEEMKRSSNNLIVSLEKNMSSFIASYQVNEYEKLVHTEMEHSDSLAILVEDYNMGKIVGEKAFVTGKIRNPDSNEIVEYDEKNKKHNRLLKNSFYSQKYRIADSSGNALGSITIYKSGKSMNDTVNNLIVGNLLTTIVISLLLIITLFYSIRYFLLSPLSNIVEIIGKTDEDGIPTQTIPTQGSSEIEALSSTMNKMITTIRESRIRLTEQHEELVIREDQLRTLSMATEQSPVSVIIASPEGIIEYVNPQFEKTSGFNANEVKGNSVDFLFQQSKLDQVQIEKLGETLRSGKRWIGEITLLSKKEESYTIRLSATPILIEHEAASHYLYVAEDITEHLRNEKMLRNTQKMDALGKLTGGIAHDYNNILGIITGYAEQLRKHVSENNQMARYVYDIEHAAERGSKLTRKLLAFSRDAAPNKSVLDMSALIKEQQHMLEKTITARYKLTLDLEESTWPVELDGGELEDAVINMCINAVHAMEQSGTLTIQTRNTHIPEVDAQASQMQAGDYVLLSITDTGKGMDEVTRERVFDPFYTTKGEQGTGLGLSQVYGFVERSGGTIKVNSEPDHGTTFSLYFPRSNKALSKDDKSSAKKWRDYSGSETLLVVDDEPSMVELARDIFSAQGYQVLTAGDGKQALTVLEDQKVDLIITDLIMPNMGGYELASRVQKLYPYIKLQLVSGFSDDRYSHKEVVDISLLRNMLYKPYRSKTILARVRDLLDQNNQNESVLAGRTILVVDDDDDVQKLFQLNLTKIGCKSISARNSREALSQFEDSLRSNSPIDATIMDLSIPGDLTGKQIAEKIKILQPDAKIIVASGHSTSSEMLRYHEHGFDGSLEKNFNRDNIKDVLERVLA